MNPTDDTQATADTTPVADTATDVTPTEGQVDTVSTEPVVPAEGGTDPSVTSAPEASTETPAEGTQPEEGGVDAQ